MLSPRVPYHTIEADPKDSLQKLKNGLIEFEDLGFASSLNDHPAEYANRQLALLQEILDNERLWMTYGNEAGGLFLKEYYLRTMLKAADENLWEILDLDAFLQQFHNMQKIVTEVFPYWVDNDYIYGLGKNMLNILRSASIPISDTEQLKALLSDVAILGLPPAVSIIMPTYNRGEKLFEVLPTIMHQTYDNFELVIVDDGSDDNTSQVIETYGNPKIKYIKLPESGGQAKARNIGIQNASFAFIAFADSDDLWDEKKLEIQMKTLLAHPEAGFCYCSYNYHDENDKIHIVPRRDIATVRKTGYIYPELLRRNMVGTPALLVKKECLDTVGGFNEELNCFEDWELALRLSKQYEACFVKDPLFDAFEDKDKVSGRTLEEGREAMSKFYPAFETDRIQFGMTDEVV